MPENSQELSPVNEEAMHKVPDQQGRELAERTKSEALKRIQAVSTEDPDSHGILQSLANRAIN